MRKRYFSINTLKNKFLVTMIILTFTPITIITYLSINTSKEILETNYIENYQSSLSVSSNNLTLLLNPVVNTLRTIISNEELQRILRENKQNPITSIEAQFIEKTFTEVMSQHRHIEVIYLIREDNIYYRDKKNDNSGDINQIDLDHIKQEEWYKQAIEENGKEIFFASNLMEDYITNQSLDHEYITCVKLLRDTQYPFEEQGVLLVSLRQEILEGVFSGENLTDVSNNYIYDSKTGDFISEVSENPASIESKKEIIQQYSNDSTYKNDEYIISSYLNETTGWELYNVIERKWLSDKSYAIMTRSIMIAIFMFIVIMILFVIISKAINQPLEKLAKSIKKFGDGEEEIKGDFDDSEIGMIGKQFVEVVNNNSRLNKQLMMSLVKQKEAEVVALQEQIKPHFLYNTLHMIYWKANISGDDEIAEIAIDLSNIFKLTLNNGKLLISIKEEINHVKCYMNIQQKRYRERLKTYIDIEEDIEEIKIIKFILQPIVENAIKHGIEPKVEGGTVSVLGKSRGNDIIFIITDDGVGCDDINLLEQGYGLKNIEERIKLYYGEQYGLTIESRKNIGTKVSVTISKEQSKWGSREENDKDIIGR